MLAFISHPVCLLHDMGEGHSEQPARIKVIEEAVKNSRIISELEFYEAPFATRKELIRVHDKNYVEEIFQIAPEKGIISLDPDTWMNPYTLNAALRAAGALIMAVDLVMKKEVRAAFCNVRPPGHHAEKNRAMGFCFFNNVAVGVAHALEHHHLKRIAIIDFDVHHGNGTENIFQEDERVLLCSSFQHPFYPYSGTDNKHPNILSLPLPAGTNSKLFRDKVTEKWLPALKNFKPEMIFFSAGFDAHASDPLANLFLLEEDYAWITREIKNIAEEFAEGRMVSTLEGGYNLDALAKSALAHIEAMLK